MSIINKMRRQFLVLWKYDNAGSYGVRSYQVPIVLECRWEDKTVNISLKNGEVYSSKSIIYVENPPEIGDYVALLGDEEIPLPEPFKTIKPVELKTAFLVRHVEITPKLKNNQKLVAVYI